MLAFSIQSIKEAERDVKKGLVGQTGSPQLDQLPDAAIYAIASETAYLIHETILRYYKRVGLYPDA